MKITQTGVGTAEAPGRIRSTGAETPVQIDAPADGLTTYKVNGRVAPDAPWMEVIAAGTTDAMVFQTWLPELQLEVTAGAGTVSMWVGE